MSGIQNTVGPDMDDLIHNNPGWLIRKGNAIFLLILCILLLTSWMIKYPDLVKASLTLSTGDLPKAINSPANGKLLKLFVKNKGHVQSGQIMAYLEVNGNHEQVQKLSSMLDSIERKFSQDKLQVFVDEVPLTIPGLGDLQFVYESFYNEYLKYRSTVANGSYVKRERILESELQNLRHIAQNLKIQKELSSENMKLAKETLTAQYSLLQSRVIAPLEYKHHESVFLSKQLSDEQLGTELFVNKNLQSEKKKELLDLRNAISTQKQIFYQALVSLKTSLEDWERKYIVYAPFSGTVLFSTPIQENQHISINQELFYILPLDNDYLGTMYVEQHKLGKIKIGQRVMLKFTGYPYTEFGLVEGRINSIAEFPRDNSYLTFVTLPKGLQTTYNKQIVFRSGMMADAEILTDEPRLLSKFTANFEKVFER